MKQKSRLRYIFTLLLVTGFVSLETARSAESVEQTIDFLLAYVSKADVTFIRNGDAHSPAEGVKHLQAKYDHFKPQIKTPEDFIRLCASKSLLSGKPYLVRAKDGKEERLDEWLMHALEEHRQHNAAE